MINENIITCDYKEPKWSGICSEHQYGLDVLKNGVIMDNLNLTGRPFYIIGRYKTYDLIFEHPSLSRFHSVLQYCSRENDEGKQKGWYLIDLDSTHGTILNKKRIPSHTFIRVHTGHVIKFGGSTRLYIVTGPEEDKEELNKYTWTELMERKNSKNLKVADASGYLAPDNSNEPIGCTWGMNDIYDNDENGADSKLDGQRKNEELYKDDPKKVIKNYFEKEGFDESPQYEFSRAGFNRNICKLELPVFGENGVRIVAEVSGSDKKNDLITKCSMEACRILDEMDELYKAGGSEGRQKKDNKYYEEKDYYSSDEDDFFDRTGQIEEKRKQRMRRFGVMSEVVEDKRKSKIEAKDSDSVLVKFRRLEEINEEILSIENKVEEANKAMDASQNSTELDEIEKYIESIQSGTVNSKMLMKLRAQIFELTREENLLRKQLKLSIPVTSVMRTSLYQCKERQKSEQPSPPLLNDISESSGSPETSVRNLSVKNRLSKQKPEDTIETESDDEGKAHLTELAADKKRKQILNEKNNSPESKRMKLSLNKEEVAENSDWVPPKGQTGDGKTSLNEKFGY